jgi:hypothetical protein
MASLYGRLKLSADIRPRERARDAERKLAPRSNHAFSDEADDVAAKLMVFAINLSKTLDDEI